MQTAVAAEVAAGFGMDSPQPPPNLSPLLHAAALLLSSQKAEGSNHQSQDLRALLEARLQTFYAEQGKENNGEFDTLEDVQLATAIEALSIIEAIDSMLRSHISVSIPIGARDWRTVRTLISLVFKWGLQPLLASINEVWAPKATNRRFVEVDSKSKDHQKLAMLITRIMTLIFPEGLNKSLSQSPVAGEVAQRHTVDVLRPALTLGWLPKQLATSALPVIDHLRPFAMRLLSSLSPAIVISALGNILSGQNDLPPYVRRTASNFLTQQLLRPGGVLGLCESVFGTEEALGEDVPLDKLEKVSRTLLSVPAKMDSSEYFHKVVPKILQLLADNTPASYRKIAAYTLSQMLGSDKTFVHREVASSVIFSTLHRPFTTPPPIIENVGIVAQENPDLLRPSVALSRLLVLIANCDPSPEVISNLLEPIVPALYSLLFHLSTHRASDPRLKESVQGLLTTWGKIVDTVGAVGVFWVIIVQGQSLHWKTDLEGNFSLSEVPEQKAKLDFLLPEDAVDGENEPDIDTNLFDFYPDPVHFVSFLKGLDRGDVVSELFIKLLEAYREQRMMGRRQDPMKTLHYLQIFMQMQVQLLGDTSSSILRQPEQLLSFVKQVLESASSQDEETRSGPEEIELGSLRIVPRDEDELSEGDSDDDDPDSEVVKPDDELLETTINLLLSVLESHEDLSVRQTPALNDIFELLEPISLNGSSILRPLAREARMVITARSASSSTMNQQPGKAEKEGSQEKYQKALKLLQDPILPVRAHGLLLLRELVTVYSKGKGSKAGNIDPALTPAILSIFLQSIQDEDSYIFLNGVQGLASMVDGFGSEVLANLVREYSDGLERNGAFMTEQELNNRVRVGEALGIVIKRCGTSLGKYRDMLIPALIRVFRLRTIPVTLRTSSLSLLADAIDTYPLAMLPYIEDLGQSMVDLLQVETQGANESAAPPPSKNEKNDEGNNEQDDSRRPPGDNDHLATNPKYPPLRRAALHLLGLLIRSTTRNLDDDNPVIPFSGNLMKRARLTLGYVASTDQDGVARAMAREIKEEMATFEAHLLGHET
ncbi:hypothetical protein CC1G_00280 [Coprinopsis cinerea okayama7|uniref:Uncharacterized protein n=1 Tax=Coprinopsis cinerea (strain Okayama-7 / 130 / ATCC MYA-4618 / FGSC 9003) TaxID=240176 RepID=A8NXE4_COPC7|nr:hypothetical protein CC1G_00280 [Coprinopsis cinerea okayama7\|eukprot:XP_001837144.2 hypothetical protein CC1G_00280 [Coprinopsis cinerea okayama7\